MKIHELKTDPNHYCQIESGSKKAEVRFNDRDYKVGDILHQRQTCSTGENMAGCPDHYPLKYTGRYCLSEITHIHNDDEFGMKDNSVVLSVKVLHRGFDKF
jgi:hypothetical protein